MGRARSRLCHTVSFVSYLIFVTCSILEIVLLWRLIQERLWRRYPGFACYVVYELVAALALFGVLQSNPSLYRSLYWNSEIVSLILGFFVFWDVFRYSFPKNSNLRAVMFDGLVTVGLIPMISAGSIWLFASYRRFHQPYRALEHGLGFLLASLVLVVLIASKYYDVSIGRNVWGIALGLGSYASISIAIFGLTDLIPRFVPYMQLLRPLAFLWTLGIWTWAMWTYAPNPASDTNWPSSGTARASWAIAWKHTISAVTKSLRQ